MSLLLLLKTAGSSGVLSFSLTDTASLQAVQGSFDTVNTDIDEFTAFSSVESIASALGFFPGDSCAIRVSETLSATISSATAQALTETASIAVDDQILKGDVQATLADTASVSVDDAITNAAVIAGAVTETASLSLTDSFASAITSGVEIDIAASELFAIELDDALSVQVRILTPVTTIRFFPLPDHIRFQIL